MPFSDYNQFLLLCLLEEFGEDGVHAFAASVKGGQHNVVSARTAGGEGGLGAAVTILPWMQAEMAPRRRAVSVVWPEDGADWRNGRHGRKAVGAAVNSAECGRCG